MEASETRIEEVPEATVEEGAVEENVHVVLRDENGEVKQEERISNLIVTAGRDAIVDQLLASPGVAKPGWMEIGTGTTAANAADTTLETALDRNALTSKTRSTNVLTMVGDWAAGDGTGAITEAGVFSASSAGTMYARAVFSVINKAAGDTLSITWTFTLTVS